MTPRSVLIRVPASVGGFGGATDAAALALDATLNVKVTPRRDGEVMVRYFGNHGERVPRDASNLTVRAMEGTLRHLGLEFTGADFEMYSSVPVGVGLGSSAAAVLAGIVAADRLYRLALDEKTLFDLASKFESRADNLRAAWFGGLVTQGEEDGTYRPAPVPPDCTLQVVIPRGGFRSVDAGRLKSVPGLDEALQVSAPGLLAVFRCGSGPAVGLLADGGHADVISSVKRCFARYGVATTTAEFTPTNSGARELNGLSPEALTPAAQWVNETPHPVSLIPV